MNSLYRSIKANTSKDFQFYCYTEDSTDLDSDINIIQLKPKDNINKQWYKIDFHNMQQFAGKKCLILDIDQIIVNNIDDVIGWDLPKYHFGCNFRWWSALTDYCSISGGFQMFYQGDTKHLYEIFYMDPTYWQSYYINIGHATGPVNGEQNFIDKNIDMKRSWLPQQWFAKYYQPELEHTQRMWYDRVKKTHFFAVGEFDEDIKIVHFSNPNNDMDQSWIEYYTHR